MTYEQCSLQIKPYKPCTHVSATLTSPRVEKGAVGCVWCPRAVLGNYALQDSATDS
jgi:hypothetical protein